MVTNSTLRGTQFGTQALCLERRGTASGVPQMREQIDSDSLVLLYLPQVVLGLHPQPYFGRGRAKGAGKPHSHLRRNSSLAVQRARRRNPAHAWMLCRRRNAHLAEILADRVAGLQGIVDRISLPLLGGSPGNRPQSPPRP